MPHAPRPRTGSVHDADVWDDWIDDQSDLQDTLDMADWSPRQRRYIKGQWGQGHEEEVEALTNPTAPRFTGVLRDHVTGRFKKWFTVE